MTRSSVNTAPDGDRMEAIEKAAKLFRYAMRELALEEHGRAMHGSIRDRKVNAAEAKANAAESALLSLVREAVQGVDDPANALGWCCHCTKERATTTRLLSTSLCEPCAATVDGSSVTPTTEPESQ